jgi:hypothetical protein
MRARSTSPRQIGRQNGAHNDVGWAWAHLALVTSLSITETFVSCPFLNRCRSDNTIYLRSKHLIVKGSCCKAPVGEK